jgi:hypothetical protein
MRVGICFDQAVPSELVRDAQRVERALIEKGHTVAYIVGDPSLLLDYAAPLAPSELYQGPVRRALPELVMKRPPADSFGDVVALAGFDHRPTLVTLASLWMRQFHLLKLDALVAFYAPVVWLVGPAYAPTFAVGNGLTLPPVLGASFPQLSAKSTPLASDAAMVDNANAVLARLGRPGMAMLSDLLEPCRSILYGLPLLDPYLRFRKTPTTGLLRPQTAPRVPPKEHRLSVFLSAHCPNIETIILGLAGVTSNIGIDVCVAGATAGMRRFLEEQARITVWTDYELLLDTAAKSTAIVHHGVQDVAERALLLGRPQLMIPWTREQDVLAHGTSWLNLSLIKPPTLSIDEMAAAFTTLIRDTSLTVSAQHHAREIAKMDLPDALPGIIRQIEGAAAPDLSPRKSDEPSSPISIVPSDSSRSAQGKVGTHVAAARRKRAPTKKG